MRRNEKTGPKSGLASFIVSQDKKFTIHPNNVKTALFEMSSSGSTVACSYSVVNSPLKFGISKILLFSGFLFGFLSQSSTSFSAVGRATNVQPN